MLTALLLVWLQMSAPQLGAPIFTSEPSVISSADGSIQIGGFPLEDIVNRQIDADETDGKPPKTPKPAPNIVKFPCDPAINSAIIIGSNAEINDNQTPGYGCPFYTGGKKVTNITINGTHYDWCISRNKYTECHKDAPKKSPVKHKPVLSNGRRQPCEF